MARQETAHFQSYLRNLQRIYWVEFIEAQTDLINGRTPSCARSEPRSVAPPDPSTSCLSATYDHFRYRRA